MTKTGQLRETQDRVKAHLRVPLYHNAYALAANSLITSVLGILYWVLAARNYSADIVGLNSALLAALLFLSHAAQLNMVNVLNRFLPGAGPSARQLIIATYLIAAAVAALMSLAFLVGIRLWSPELQFLNADRPLAIWFVLSTAAWCIFALQDGVLAGLRQAVWVPIENLVFALTKIALLLVLASFLPRSGVFMSWTLPLLPILLVMNFAVFRWLIHRNPSLEPVAAPQASKVAKYAAGDYVASLFWSAAIGFVPLIVLERAGPESNAYFYQAWTITYTLFLLSRNFGMSLTAEGAADPGRIAQQSYALFKQTLKLLAPAVVLLVVAAPYILRLFGEAYAIEGVALLRLLALSALPYSVIAVYQSVARVQRRMQALILTSAAGSVIALFCSIVLVDAYGIVGVGIAWLIANTAVALALLPALLLTFWLPFIEAGPTFRLLAKAKNGAADLASRIRPGRSHEWIAEVFARISAQNCPPLDATWKPQRILPTVSDVTVLTVGPAEGPATAILKLPKTPEALTSLKRQKHALQTLKADSRLTGFHRFLPDILAEGQELGQPYFVERMLPGTPARTLLAEGVAQHRIQNTAVSAITQLHRNTSRLKYVDDDVLYTWVAEPLGHIRSLSYRSGLDTEAQLARLSKELTVELSGRPLTLSWVHGDFTPGNILIDRARLEVTALVDWTEASPLGLPRIDVLHLLISMRMTARQREIGEVVRGLLSQEPLSPQEIGLLEASPGGALSSGPPIRTLILLAWLQHISSNLAKSTRYHRHSLWVARNVDAVVGAV